MDNPASLRIINDVAVVQLQAPPVNALGAALRSRLWDIFQGIAGDLELKGVVILASGRVFSAGEDIKELGKFSGAPSLSDLCTLIEDCRVPVVAGLQGAALGGGAELAMAAHYRLALTDAVIGLPEVTLGLVPGAGGTQRLPRLVGPKPALNMILGGRSISAGTARRIGLVDGVVAKDLAVDAMALARQMDRPRPTYARRAMLVDGGAYLDQIAERRAILSASDRFAPMRALECVEAALLLPFHAGLTFEADAFTRCLGHPQSQALRHLFLAERRVSSDLLTRTRDGWDVIDPLGAAMVDALDKAWWRALSALQRQGITEEEIDRAHVDNGFLRGPFGGQDGDAGAQGPEIQLRVLAALVAEGARLVEAGVGVQASDIDVLAVHGLGYPRSSGGPMMAAKLAGLLPLGEQMKRWSADDPVWQPPPLFLRAALFADGFDALAS